MNAKVEATKASYELENVYLCAIDSLFIYVVHRIFLFSFSRFIYGATFFFSFSFFISFFCFPYKYKAFLTATMERFLNRESWWKYDVMNMSLLNVT